ncbi:hypothetical protein B0H13DRAFT_1902793 [Mycena leptocephala]|nr:hypothetical protein B0H13DRAFT_1902793 [Mycena leptocephala]
MVHQWYGHDTDRQIHNNSICYMDRAPAPQSRRSKRAQRSTGTAFASPWPPAPHCVPMSTPRSCPSSWVPRTTVLDSKPDCQVGDGAVGEFFLGNPDATFVNTADEFVSSADVKSFICT